MGGVLVLLSVSCQSSQEQPNTEEKNKYTGPPLYQDVTAGSGVEATFRNGEEEKNYVILESLGGGVGLIDYDGDGLLDIVVAGGGYFAGQGKEKKLIQGCVNRVYKNLGNFTFKDVTKEVGLDHAPFFSHGVAVADYDRDGWPDLLITGYGRVALYRNVPGPNKTRRFVEVTKEVGLLTDHFWATSAAWADFDGDGYPDLYICQYVNWSWQNNPPCAGYNPRVKRDICAPKTFKSVPHLLFRNDGKGRFIDVTQSAGIRVDRRAEVPKLTQKLEKLEIELKSQLKEGKITDEQRKKLTEKIEFAGSDLERAKNDDFGKGLGVIVVDVNGDRKPDIYVANDTTDNFLYLNRSQPGHIFFEEVGMEMGVARDDQGRAEGSMGTDAADPFGSGWPSLWCTNYEGELHALYRNTRRGDQNMFQWATNNSGIAAIGQLYVGFGTGFLDIDNDGWEDIFITNGHVIRHPSPAPLAQKPVMFLNTGEGKFQDITGRCGDYFQTGHRGRGVAIGDLNNDGLPDLVVSHVEEPITILKNVSPAGHHWLGVRLATTDNRTLAGTKLILEVNGKKLTRFAKGGASYLSANDTRQIFGLGKAVKSGKLTVEWATGEPRNERWENLDINKYHKLVQGTGTR